MDLAKSVPNPETTMKLTPLILLGLAAGCAPATDSSAQGSKVGSTPSARAAARPVGAPSLAFPVACTIGETCALQNHVDRDPGPEAKDYRCGHQTYEAHGGVDIRLLDMAAQRAGVDVLAASSGRVTRLRDGVADVSVKAAGAPPVVGQECGNGVVIDHGGGWETQYCHLAQGSVRVKVGDAVVTGQPLAQVGLSGNTEYPHLHITVRRDGATIDPFAPSAAPGTCDPMVGPDGGLWDQRAAEMLSYRRGLVLSAGFAGTSVSMDAAESGALAGPTPRSPVLIAYARAINLEAGDVQELSVTRPDGRILAQSTLPPLDRAKAQYVMYAGKRTPPEGWPMGEYVATYSVRRAGRVALEKTFNLRF